MTTQGTPAPGPSAEAGPATATPVSSEPTTATNATAATATLRRPGRAVVGRGRTGHLAMVAPSMKGGARRCAPPRTLAPPARAGHPS